MLKILKGYYLDTVRSIAYTSFIQPSYIICKIYFTPINRICIRYRTQYKDFLHTSAMWNSRDTVAVVELIFYIPTIFLSFFVCYKHGFKRSSGWLYTLILCLVRIIGAICQFVADNNPSKGLLQTIFILDSVGLSPLLLSTLGVLHRFVDFINARTPPTFTTRHFRVIQIVIIVGLILSVAGGTSISPSSSGSYDPPSTSKVAVILYIVGFVASIFVLVVSLPRRSIVPGRERHVPIAILLAIPFICVRLLYTILSVFLHDHTFSIGTGSVAAQACMALVEEFVVVGLYVLLGLWVERLDTSVGDDHPNGPKRGVVNRAWPGSSTV